MGLIELVRPRAGSMATGSSGRVGHIRLRGNVTVMGASKGNEGCYSGAGMGKMQGGQNRLWDFGSSNETVALQAIYLDVRSSGAASC